MSKFIIGQVYKYKNGFIKIIGPVNKENRIPYEILKVWKGININTEDPKIGTKDTFMVNNSPISDYAKHYSPLTSVLST